MPPLLVWGRYLLAGSGSERTMLERGAAYIDNGIIRQVGEYSELRKRFPSAKNIGSSDVIVLPGLVNAHQHGNGLSFSQRGRKDRSLELWSVGKALPGDDDPYWDTLYACTRFLQAGVTTVVHSHPDRYPDHYEWRAERTLEAYQDAGIRVAFALSTVDKNNFVYASDQEFVNTLPVELRRKMQTAFTESASVTGERFFSTFHQLRRKFGKQSEGRIQILLAPVGPQWCSDDLLQEIERTAAEYGVGIHIHLLESRYQKEYGLRQHNGSLLTHLAKLGLVGEHVSYAHGVWLTESDAQLLSQTRTSVVNNPSSNLRLGSGIAPIRMLLAHGVNTALGTDSASINEDEDFWTEMRLGLYLHRLPGSYSGWPNEYEMFRMATSNGGSVARYSGQVGALEQGMLADLILVRVPVDRLTFQVNAESILSLLLAQTSRNDVATVIVDGRVLIDDGTLIELHPEEILRKAIAEAKASSSDKSVMVEALTEVTPYVKAYFDDWDLSDLNPVYEPNSRN